MHRMQYSHVNPAVRKADYSHDSAMTLIYTA